MRVAIQVPKYPPFENLDGERWAPIVGWPGYEISSAGRVRKESPFRYAGEPPFLVPTKMGSHDYPMVVLRRQFEGHGWRSRKCYLHRLVAIAFLGDKGPEYHVHHKDVNRNNPRLENLEWLTGAEHRQVHLALKRPFKMHKAHLPQMKLCFEIGLTVAQIARAFKIEPNYVSRMLLRTKLARLLTEPTP